MDPFERDTTPNLSMREKSALKRRITREHNSNFRAGYININEQYLHKTGIRGRKRYFLYCLMMLLFLVAIINALLTTAIIYCMRISPQHGMAVEYIPDYDLLRFIGKTVFDTVHIFNGGIGSRADKELYIEGNDNSVTIRDTGPPTKPPTVSVGPHKTELHNIERLSIVHTQTKEEMFSTSSGTTLQLDGYITNLKSPEIILHNITSKMGIPNLILESIGSHVNLSGSEGVELSSADRSITFYARRHEVHLYSTNGDLILDAAGGIRFDILQIPKVISASGQGPLTYKLCVCIPQGRLFAVPVTGPGIGCYNADNNNDPCQ